MWLFTLPTASSPEVVSLEVCLPGEFIECAGGPRSLKKSPYKAVSLCTQYCRLVSCLYLTHVSVVCCGCLSAAVCVAVIYFFELLCYLCTRGLFPVFLCYIAASKQRSPHTFVNPGKYFSRKVS